MIDEGTPVSTDRPVVSLPRLIAIVLVFALLGPIVWALIFVVLFGTIGIVTMGPMAIFAGLMYFSWWLPAIYVLLGPPFLLTGVLYAAAVRLFAPGSLVSALLAGAVAFAAYLGAYYWLTGSFDTPSSRLGPSFLADPWSIAWIAVLGVLPCWWLTRDWDRPTRWY